MSGIKQRQREITAASIAQQQVREQMIARVAQALVGLFDGAVASVLLTGIDPTHAGPQVRFVSYSSTGWGRILNEVDPLDADKVVEAHFKEATRQLEAVRARAQEGIDARRKVAEGKSGEVIDKVIKETLVSEGEHV